MTLLPDETGETLLALWLECHDTETPEQYAAVLACAVPFDFTPTVDPSPLED